MLPRIPRRANPLGRGPFGPAVDRGRLRHIESSGRSPEERRAAAEARARARAGEPETGDEERLGEAGPRGARGEMSRLYGGGDVFRRRRLIAAAAIIIVVLLLLFLLVGGC